MHSAQWDDTYDLTGKTVAVIGGGSSAVQIIPCIQPGEDARLIMGNKAFCYKTTQADSHYY
jgi:cation diffusion facilitator CzcD-associated flavoprotein CzcO